MFSWNIRQQSWLTRLIEAWKTPVNLPKIPFNGMSWRFLAVTTTFRNSREVGCTGEVLSWGWPILLAGSSFLVPWIPGSEPAPLPSTAPPAGSSVPAPQLHLSPQAVQSPGRGKPMTTEEQRKIWREKHAWAVKNTSSNQKSVKKPQKIQFFLANENESWRSSK